MSIIGAKHLIPHLRHRKDKTDRRDPKVMEAYDDRESILIGLGYRSYREYLSTPEWAEIKRRVLVRWPLCLICLGKSQVVHHVKYWDSVLLGLDDRRLAALCHACHERIEIGSDGKKARIGTANVTLFQAARKTVYGMVWIEDYHDKLRATRGRAKSRYTKFLRRRGKHKGQHQSGGA